jgi:hypothetical protein
MTDYDVATVIHKPSSMAEFDPVFIGRIEKLIPYVIRFVLYLISGCMYISIIYLYLLVIAGKLYR